MTGDTTKTIAFGFAFISIVYAVPSSRTKREISPEVEIRSVMEDVWGGACVTDANCADIISHCDMDQGVTVLDGECRLVWWVWLLAALLLLFLLLSVVSCLCLPCCCLYNCCSALFSCICCCCPSRRRGYTVARTG